MIDTNSWYVADDSFNAVSGFVVEKDRAFSVSGSVSKASKRSLAAHSHKAVKEKACLIFVYKNNKYLTKIRALED